MCLTGMTRNNSLRLFANASAVLVLAMKASSLMF